MKFILAPDSYKESMTAKAAGLAMAAGVRNVLPQAVCWQIPLADGGEGTMQALVDATGGTIYQTRVKDPLGQDITGEYAILGDGETGVVELASASGLHLVPPARRNPLLTTTYGTGQLIRAVLAHDIKHLVIGIGGSATNDGGAGLAQALGVRFLDQAGREIGFGGRELLKIETIDTSQLITRQRPLRVEVACDVTNPLTGEQGAAQIYGPQKGATPAMVTELDRALSHYAAKIRTQLGREVAFKEGAGAAGGTGAGLLAFLEARLVKGIDLVLKYSGLETNIPAADYIFTGEGSLDDQTIFGKTIAGVTRLAQQHHKPIIAFAGRISDQEALFRMGLTAVVGILPGVCTLEEALRAGPVNLEKAVSSVVRLLNFERNIRA